MEVALTGAKPFNREIAKQQPESCFATPLEIVGHPLLTRGEKLATLERWRLNIFGDLAATNEGMRTCGYSAGQLKTLNAIEDAKTQLHQTS